MWWPPGGTAGVVVTEQTALQSAALMTALEVVATDTSILPLQIWEHRPDRSKRLATDHAGHELLSLSPDGTSTPLRFRQTMMLHTLIYGNGYAEIQRLGNGKPYALHILDPASTVALRDNEMNLYYSTGGPGWGAPPAFGQKRFDASDVLHFAGLSYDAITGYNMIRLLRQTVGLSIAGDTFAADYFSNGSESGGVIEVPGRLKDEDAVTRMRNRWEGRHQGAGRRHRVAVLEEGAKYNSTTPEPEKTQLLESRKYQVLDTIRAWRVPPHKAGDYSQSHLANIEASNLDYLQTTLIGWLVMIEQEANLKLLTRAEWRRGYRFEHDVSALLRGDLKTRFETYKAAIQDGWMSRDEVRGKEGLDPMGPECGGDLYTVQMQVVPLVPDQSPLPDGSADDAIPPGSKPPGANGHPVPPLQEGIP